MKFGQSRKLLAIFGVLAIVISLISVLVYIATSNFIRQDYFKTIQIRTGILMKLDKEMHHEESGALDQVLTGLSEKLENERDYKFPVSDLNISAIEDTLDLPRNFLVRVLDDEAAQGYRDGQFYFAMIAQVGDQKMIYLTISEHQVAERIGAYMKRVSFLAIISIVLFSIITYFYLSRSVFKPISTISEKVRQISAENLHLRLELPENNIELLKLATTFNDMINRLETSFETQNNFISNASHELRTPLTAIMGVSEVCLSKERSKEEYIETIQVMMEEAEKLDSKTQALLMLAQTGFDGKAQKFEVIRLDELLWEVKSTVDKLNRDNKVVFDLDLLPDNPYKLKVSGNAQMLHLAFTNLILNGCKYSDNDIVIISVGVTESSIVVIIKDNGIGIPSNEIQYIYDPFFRASNTSAYKGYGIGLPLARNIIIMHKGTLDVQSVDQKGVTVKVKLPLAFPAR